MIPLWQDPRSSRGCGKIRSKLWPGITRVNRKIPSIPATRIRSRSSNSNSGVISNQPRSWRSWSRAIPMLRGKSSDCESDMRSSLHWEKRAMFQSTASILTISGVGRTHLFPTNGTHQVFPRGPLALGRNAKVLILSLPDDWTYSLPEKHHTYQ